ncbi:MAG TPA: FkbM family methyltransferase [Methanocorpusculum sp.]|nr:FkbM family methyltransferase [Methanocorpusculum sp.]HJK79468.1 FkbM family methyltransferase [Methanocorpusculum sp.]
MEIVVDQKLMSLGKQITPKCLLPFARKCFENYVLYKRNSQNKKILTYYRERECDDEINDIIEYLSQNGLAVFPYSWANTQDTEIRSNISSLKVSFDPSLNLPYTYLDGKRLYYPREWSDDSIKESFFGEQMVAQHPLSPHRYLTNEFSVDENSIVVDCGVAEGNFGLSIVEKCKKLYLFEPEERWMEPLKATFAPWKDKVVIVQKYLSDTKDEMNTTLDDFFADKEYPNFLKLDVEGYEERLLRGAEKIVSSDCLRKVVTCTYHKAEDEEVLGKLLRDHGFTVVPSQGYMIFIYDSNGLHPPYLRRGVLRATKIQ